MEKDRIYGKMDQHQINRLLQESIACYRKLMQVYDRLGKKLSSGGAAETLQALIDQSRELYTVVQHVNNQFHRLADENQISLEDVPLFFEWRTLLTQVREENKRIRQQLQTSMVVLKDDMGSLGQSKRALGGYRSRKDCRGEKINLYST